MSASKPKKPSVIRVSREEEDRVDRFLAKQYPDWSRTSLQKLINKRFVTVDGHPVAPNNKLKSGQTVEIKWPVAEKREKKTGDHPLPFPILFEDDELIVLNKPPSLVVHPSAGHRDGNTLVELVEPRIQTGPWPDEMRPGLVHRLDRDTSGVIIIAKTPEAHANLTKQFARRQIKKTYWALAIGRIEANEGTLESHIARHPGLRQRFAVSASGRWASTKFKVLERMGEWATLVELQPLTGRTHQIRVHLASYGHPIIGDHVYGLPDGRQAVKSEKSFEFVKRQLLHAHEIEFEHPISGKVMKLKAPVPEDFQEAIKVIRLRR